MRSRNWRPRPRYFLAMETMLGMFLGVPIFACISSLVNWFTNRSLTKKGVTDDAMFDPAPAAPLDEKKD